MPVDMSMIGLAGIKQAYEDEYTAAQTAFTQANARKTNLESDKEERINALNEQVADRLKFYSNPDNRRKGEDLGFDLNDPSGTMYFAGRMAMEAGMPEYAKDLMKAGSEIAENQQQVLTSAATQRKTQLEAIQTGTEIVSSYLGTATSQAEWDYGVRKLREADVMPEDQVDKLAAAEWSPELSTFFGGMAAKYSERMNLKLREQEHNDLQTQRDIDNNRADSTQALQIVEAGERARHNRAIEKAGGGADTAVGATPDGIRKGAEASLRAKYPDLSGVARDDAVEAISGQVNLLLKQNKALDQDTAIQQVITEMNKNGAFKTVDPMFGAPDTSFDRGAAGKGKTAANPLPTPKKSDAMRKGYYYNTPKGVLQWNGEGFIVP